MEAATARMGRGRKRREKSYGSEERRLAVVCPPGPVRRLFEVAGVTDLLAIYESRAAATAALPG